MKKIYGLSLLLLFVSVIAQATPSVRFKYALNSQNEWQMKISGHDLCDSKTFRIRVTNDATGDSNWYKSESSGKTEWNVNPQACNIDMMLAKKYLQPGNLLQVRTYRADGSKSHTFSKVIPCEETQWINVFNGDVDIYETTILTAMTCSAPPPAPVPAGPSCTAKVQVSEKSPNTAEAWVSCIAPVATQVYVGVYSAGGNLLCENKQIYVGPNLEEVCSFTRDRTRRLDYKIHVDTTFGTVVHDDGVIFKDPTYNFRPEGHLVSESYMQPASQDKKLGRGQFWDVTIKAIVADGDVDPSENRQLIKVELIEVNGGIEHGIKTQMANSGETASFDLEHEFIKPLVVGKPHESGDLHRGQNTLKVRVWDAYQGQDHIDLPEITVTIH